MRRPLFGTILGIPWLGLPLGGLLAWAALLPLGGDPGRASGGRDAAAAGFGASGGPSESGNGPSVYRAADLRDELRAGESLGFLFAKKLGLSAADASEASRASARFVDLRQLRPGALWAAYLDDDGRLDRFELAVASRGELTLVRGELEWESIWRDYRRETRLLTIQGVLVDNLESAVERAGAQAELAYAIAEVLQWDLDFTRDLRKGDEFRVIYEEVTVEGSKPAPGQIVAVEYGQAKGRPLQAFYFAAQDGGGYFDGEGRPLQKMFLRSPLPYSRVTSRFSHRRLHPILGVFRPHYGIDYGAPAGTPVRVTASGTVVSADWDGGGGGRTVKVRHSNDYQTAYLHLSRFATGIRPGERVRQGDLIGYVGSTGLATAPHLDYRIQRGSRWIDPLSIQSAPGEPIVGARLGEFRIVRDAMRSSLTSGGAYSPPAFTIAGEPAQVATGAGESTADGRAPGTT